jgi:hypothetical protein
MEHLSPPPAQSVAVTLLPALILSLGGVDASGNLHDGVVLD